MKKCLIKTETRKLMGDTSKLTGDISGIWGEVSPDLRGNLDDCELTAADRENGVKVEDLVKKG